MNPVKVEDRIKWFEEHDEKKYPIFVGLYNGKIVGWISLSPYRPGRLALRFTAEISIFIHNEYQQQGIGAQLLKYIIQISHQYHVKTLFAIVFDSNIGSIKLFEKFRFKRWGHLPRVADFDGKELGHLYYGLRLVN